MKIRDIIKKGRPTLSFEMFPPKPGSAFEPVLEAARETSELNPDFISVTYGAGGSNAKNSVEIASFIQNELKTTAIAHMTCVLASKEDINAAVQGIHEHGIENILALRGDIPQGYSFPRAGCYNYAYQLIEALRARGDFCIGAACYPEGHIESESMEADFGFLAQKADCGCDFLTSQMFFDNNIFYRFLWRLRDMGIKIPVLAGIMPVTKKEQVNRIVTMSGSYLPPRFRTILDRYGDSPAAMKQAGIAYATEQIIDLLANGIDGVHIYSMNNAEAARKLSENIKEIICIPNN